MTVITAGRMIVPTIVDTAVTMEVQRVLMKGTVMVAAVMAAAMAGRVHYQAPPPSQISERDERAALENFPEEKRRPERAGDVVIWASILMRKCCTAT